MMGWVGSGKNFCGLDLVWLQRSDRPTFNSDLPKREKNTA